MIHSFSVGQYSSSAVMEELHSSSAVMEELQAQWLQPFKVFKNERVGGGGGVGGGGVERERDGHF